MKKYIQAAITILLCLAIILAVKTFTYKNVSLKTFIKSKAVVEVWGEYGKYDEKGEFEVNETFETDDIMGLINRVNEYKLSENKDFSKDTSEGMEEVRFYFYLNEYETDVITVTEDNNVILDMYAMTRTYIPHSENMYDELKAEFFS